MGTEGKYVAYPCTRTPTAATFATGTQEFPFSVGHPYAWCPKKSYFRFEVSLGTLADSRIPMKPSDITALADNMCGNLYDNIYLKAGSSSISSCTQFPYQCSALKARVENSLPLLKSMGSSVAANEASLQKRILAGARWDVDVASQTGIGAYDERDVYKPYAGIATDATPGNFAESKVRIDTADGKVTGTSTDFAGGMPLGGANIGGAVLAGDILVVAGVPYTVQAQNSGTELIVGPRPPADIANTADWFIVRSDTLRCPQAVNRTYVMWQPPLGIMDYSGYISSGEFSFVMNPNANYELMGVETKNPNNVSAATRKYKLNIHNVTLMVYQQKISIPQGITNYFVDEYVMDAKPYSQNLTFNVSESTRAIVIFLQDTRAGADPLTPPSMFKVRDNGDLNISSIQVTYANVAKPNTPYTSDYAPAAAAGATSLNLLQQRYHDSLYESGIDVDAVGCESFADWMRRGPFYYFSFDKDMSNKATVVQISLSSNNANLPTYARVFCCAIKRRTVQMETADGRIKSIAAADT